MSTASIVLSLLFAVHGAVTKFQDYYRPNTGDPGGVIVHLMDWKYQDIATECQTILSKQGFAGVQVTSYKTADYKWPMVTNLLLALVRD